MTDTLRGHQFAVHAGKVGFRSFEPAAMLPLRADRHARCYNLSLAGLSGLYNKQVGTGFACLPRLPVASPALDPRLAPLGQ